MVGAGSPPIAIRWGFPLVLLLISIAVTDGAAKADKAAAKTDTKGSGKSGKSSSAKKGSSSASASVDSDAPVLPGDPDYWTKLLGLGFSEGTLTPSFSPDVLKYKLNIQSGTSKELLVTPMINTNKYELLHTPSLIFSGKKQKYSPIQNIEFKQLLNKTGPGPLDMTMTVDVQDPKDKGGLFGGSGTPHKYTIRVIQAPDIEEILTATKIEVVGRTSDGTAVATKDNYDPKSPHNEIRYKVDEKVITVDVTLTCPKEATSLKYNGITWKSSDGPYKSQAFEGATKSILGQCIYKDDQWTNGQEMQRTYVITIARDSKLKGTAVDLRMWPPSQAGMCQTIGPGKDLDTETGTQCNTPVHSCNGDNTPAGCNKYKGLVPGWKCMKGPPSAQFVGSYDNAHAELLVVNKPTGGRYRLWNGIPTQIPITKNCHEDKLVLEAGTHHREYTFIFGTPPTCKTMHYADDRDASKPWRADAQNTKVSWMCGEKDGFPYEVTSETKDLSCNWDPCKPENDFNLCCRKVRMPCKGYDIAKNGEMKCPKGNEFSPGKGKCSGWPCTNSEVDLHHCCAPAGNETSVPCSAMKCPTDSVLSDGAASLNCFTMTCGKADESTCCQQRAICNSMTCPSGFSKKYNAALYLCKGAHCDVLDRDTCCDAAAYCDTFTCPSVGENHRLGWMPKPDAANIPCGGQPCIEWDTGICCNKMGFCGSFQCPLGFYRKEGSETIPCEGGGMHLCNKEDDLLKCCQPAAKCLESNVCTRGYDFKVGAALLLCRSAECQPSDRELCCDLVNPFKAATSTRVINHEGEGVCKMLDGPTDFTCKATGLLLNLHVEYTFDAPVGNKVYMGQKMIAGKVATVKIPQIEVKPKQMTIHANVDSLVAGRGAVEHRLQIVVVPPDNYASLAAPHEQKAAPAPAAPAPAAPASAAPASAAPAPASHSSSKAPAASSKGSTSGKDTGESKAASKSSSTSDTASKESSSTSGKASKGSSSSSDKASKESSSASGGSNSSSSTTSKDASSESGTVQHALRALQQRRLTEAGTSSVGPSDSADTWVV